MGATKTRFAKAYGPICMGRWVWGEGGSVLKN